MKIIQQKITNGQVFMKDGRGRHNNHRQTPANIKQSMLQHINSFPQYANHYSREKLGDFYLSPDLTAAEMFRLFQQTHQHIAGVNRMKTTFDEVFRGTGLKFGVPKSDTCKNCDAFNISRQSSGTAQANLRIVQERDEHLSKTNTAFDEMREDFVRSQNDASFVTFCCDLQQVRY